MTGMLRMSGETDRHPFWNFRNVENFRNVRTDIKCHTFLKPQPRADSNGDENFMNGENFRNVRNERNVENVRNVRTYIKCHNFLKTQALAYLEISGMVGM